MTNNDRANKAKLAKLKKGIMVSVTHHPQWFSYSVFSNAARKHLNKSVMKTFISNHILPPLQNEVANAKTEAQLYKTMQKYKIANREILNKFGNIPNIQRIFTSKRLPRDIQRKILTVSHDPYLTTECNKS